MAWVEADAGGADNFIIWGRTGSGSVIGNYKHREGRLVHSSQKPGHLAVCVMEGVAWPVGGHRYCRPPRHPRGPQTQRLLILALPPPPQLVR